VVKLHTTPVKQLQYTERISREEDCLESLTLVRERSSEFKFRDHQILHSVKNVSLPFHYLRKQVSSA